MIGKLGAPVLAAALTLSVGLAPVATAAPDDTPAPLHRAAHAGIAHHYIVVLKGTLPKHPTRKSMRRARAADERVAASVGATPDFDYVADFRGFAAHLTNAQVRQLRHHPRVKYLEQDARITMDTTQTSATWSLDRIDQRALPLDTTYTYASDGSGVTIYVIDTGIEADHPEFGSRASNGYDAIGGNGSGTDCNGHGTHVAGTAGGTTYGVAKQAELVGVRVLSCGGSGSSAGVVAGIDWVTAHHAGQAVVNMSLGGGVSTAINAAVDRLVASGAFLVAAAGNSNASACNHSPASAPNAFTVAASTSADARSSFSNFGPCVDVYAPGSHITAAWIGGGINTISGTSMAAPHAAGAAALYLEAHPSATPAGITSWLTNHATSGVITGNPTGTVNKLLYMGGL